MVKLLLIFCLVTLQVHSQTIEELRSQIDSISTTDTTSIIGEDELFNVIKETFDQSKISHTSRRVADSLFANKLYKDAILEYKRAKFYSISDKDKTYLDDKIVESLHHSGLFSKSNWKIESFTKEFDFVELAQTRYEISIIYLKNCLAQEDYSRVFLLTESVLQKADLEEAELQEYTSLYEYSKILSGHVSNVEELENIQGKTILQGYLDTPTKNKEVTYYLSTFIPGSGYMYNGNYKMGAISALVNIPLAIYLGSRIFNIADGINEKNQEKIVVNSLDFVLIYKFVFSRYWKGARNQAVIESKKINRQRKDAVIDELRGVYLND